MKIDAATQWPFWLDSLVALVTVSVCCGVPIVLDIIRRRRARVRKAAEPDTRHPTPLIHVFGALVNVNPGDVWDPGGPIRALASHFRLGVGAKIALYSGSIIESSTIEVFVPPKYKSVKSDREFFDQLVFVPRDHDMTARIHGCQLRVIHPKTVDPKTIEIPDEL